MSKKVFLDTNSLNDKNLLVELRTLVQQHLCEVFISPIGLLEYGFLQFLHKKLPQFKSFL